MQTRINTAFHKRLDTDVKRSSCYDFYALV